MTKVLEINVDDIGNGGVYSLVKNVIENKPKSLQIDIACQEPFEKQENLDYLKKWGTTVHYVGHAGNKIVKQYHIYKNLKNLMQNQKYDFVHIHSDVSNKLWVAGKAAKAAGIKNIVLHSHAAGVDGSHRQFKECIHKFFRKKLKNIGTKFVACSGLARQWMFPNIYPGRVLLINNGVDLGKFKYDEVVRLAIRKEMGFQNACVIGHVGRFAFQKNHPYLIEIFERVKKDIPNAKLLLIGEGDSKSEIETLVAQKNLKKDVIFYGSSQRVNQLFQAMDIFLLPSHFEGLPIVGVEAQASGLPVIFSDQVTREAKLTENVSFLPINNKSLGLWVNDVKKFVRIERQDTSDEIRKKQFSIEDTVHQFLNLYINI